MTKIFSSPEAPGNEIRFAISCLFVFIMFFHSFHNINQYIFFSNFISLILEALLYLCQATERFYIHSLQVKWIFRHSSFHYGHSNRIHLIVFISLGNGERSI